jgi:hypothetical protein
MLIKELRKHFPARLPEWWNAFTMFFWGAYILLHRGIFEEHIFDGLVAIATAWQSDGSTAAAERMWGLVAVVVGLTRACALFVNGSYSRTPMVRLIASLISAFVWCQVLIGLLSLPIATTGVVIYASVMGLDLLSAYRAGIDVAIAEATRRERVGGNERGVFAGVGEVSAG